MMLFILLKILAMVGDIESLCVSSVAERSRPTNV